MDSRLRFLRCQFPLISSVTPNLLNICRFFSTVPLPDWFFLFLGSCA
jgi:hypothetical protein